MANTDPEQDRSPSVLLHHQSSGPHPVITTRSGQVVKPVQRLIEQRTKGGGM